MSTLRTNEWLCRNCGAPVCTEEAVSLAMAGRQVFFCDQDCMNDSLSQARPQTLHQIHERPTVRGGLQ